LPLRTCRLLAGNSIGRTERVSRNEHEACAAQARAAGHLQPAFRRSLVQGSLQPPRQDLAQTPTKLPEPRTRELASRVLWCLNPFAHRSRRRKSDRNDSPRFESVTGQPEDAESHQRDPGPVSARPSSVGDAAPPASLSRQSPNSQEIAVGP
jgi:hypothetical protein